MIKTMFGPLYDAIKIASTKCDNVTKASHLARDDIANKMKPLLEEESHKPNHDSSTLHHEIKALNLSYDDINTNQSLQIKNIKKTLYLQLTSLLDMAVCPPNENESPNQSNFK